MLNIQSKYKTHGSVHQIHTNIRKRRSLQFTGSGSYLQTLRVLLCMSDQSQPAGYQFYHLLYKSRIHLLLPLGYTAHMKT